MTNDLSAQPAMIVPEPARKPRARVIAVHLPQYHPFPENDEWWGKGFTEWTNVTKARPLFPGHRQPNLPADLGFYDLRLPEAREEQATLARQYGVEAFCFYHYWFGNGRRLLHRPLDEIRASGKPDFPFMLCWANQTWTGIWHGAPGRVLIEQQYPGLADFEEHFRLVEQFFVDPRYLRVDGKPVFMVYRPNELPNAREFSDHWRKLAERAGLPGLYLLGEHRAQWDFKSNGFDGCVVTRLPPKRREWVSWQSPIKKLQNKALDILGIPSIHGYEGLRDYIIPDYTKIDGYYPCAIPNWDNTPRSGHSGMMFLGSTPTRFGQQLERALGMLEERNENDRFLFVKSWNEWGEGNYLEPDRRHGHAYLDALRSALTP